QSGFTSQQCPQLSSSSSGLQPSCPPYWMMLSSPQQSRLASRHCSDFWEPNPRQRSYSLNPSVLRAKLAVSDSEDDVESAAQKAKKSAKAASGGERPAAPCQRGQRSAQRAFVPDLLNPPACLSSLPHQRRKNLRQCSLSVLDTPKEHKPNTESQSKGPTSHRAPATRANTVDRLPSINNHNTTHTKSLSPDSCRNPSVTSAPTGLPSSGSDSSAELLSALSPEERELLAAITARGYTFRTAIIALQKTGRQTPDQ
ncbi:ubiquitin-associated protein 1-like, partial [Plectropomus leopardus]|uniref:ubiquitin-associated protein 1-like n=1 Tax=Plectropomus leopardus TaxID=160734 RepID=UPI001C4DA476